MPASPSTEVLGYSQPSLRDENRRTPKSTAAPSSIAAGIRRSPARAASVRERGTWLPRRFLTVAARWRCGSFLEDRVTMIAAEQADHVLRAIDDDGKEIGEIAAEDAHVEGGGIGDGGELAVERNGSACFAD